MVDGIRARSSTPLTSSAEVIPASLSLAAKSGTGVSRMRPMSARTRVSCSVRRRAGSMAW